MSKHFFPGAFLLGALTVAWVGAGFAGSNYLAMVMTALIGAVYTFGAFELHRYRQTTASFSVALSAIPSAIANLEDWLCSVPTALQNTVRLRVEGERVGLPGPALTPYLVGLLVMLGMLGTFLGMVVTLNGAVFALEGTTDLQAIRAAFAAPIKGLGLAFGTSVAGVATSAMLGLMSAVSRRERMLAAQLLDTRIATTLRQFSLAHQRQETYKALQLQSQTLPAVVNQLVSNQEAFHRHVTAVYTDLARSVDQSLRNSLTQSAHIAGESIKPMIEAAMTGISQEARLAHERLILTTQAQLDTLTSRLSATANTTGRALMDSLVQTAQLINNETQANASNTLADISRLVASSEDLMRSRMDAEADFSRQHGERMDQVVTLLRTELGALRDAEAQRGNAAVERLSQLRNEISNSLARDNMLLEDRGRITEALSALLDTINQASTHLTCSSVEVSSLGEAFRFGVGSFNDANAKLISGLQRIEGAMDKSMARSDDQMAYYVAQAREIIDLSLMAQREVFEELRELPGKHVPLAGGVTHG